MNLKEQQPIIRQLVGYFFRGLLLITPLWGTLYAILAILCKIDGILNWIFAPGLGILIVVAFITLLGYIATTLFVKSILSFTEGLIKKVPLINWLYSSLKEFTAAFVSSKRKFNRPVIVCIDVTTQIYRIGFITRESLEVLGMPNYIAVYLPNSYCFSGILIMVLPERITPLDLPSTEVMKFNFSGAVTTLKEVPDNQENDNQENDKNATD